MQNSQQNPVIHIDRTFNVDVGTLFKVWTGFEHLSQWWHPMGETLNDVKAELQDGGVVTYYIGQAGLEVTGLYKEVIPNQKLVYTWIWNMNDEGSADGYTLHVKFTAIDKNKSRLQVLQEGFSSADFLTPHQQEWDKALIGLEQYLVQLSS